MTGFVSLVGAGPWDPELLTLAGKERLSRADAVVADYLVNPALLMHCRRDVIVHQRASGPHLGARLDQHDINRLLVELAERGLKVVRLKGGDPFMFGRGGEEAEYLREHGIEFEVVPGVTSPVAAPAFAGIPVTHRDHTPAVTFVSGYEAYEKAGLQVQWEHLARGAGTIVLMMSVRNARSNTQKLIEAGRAPTTPAAAIRWGTRGVQRTLVGTLADIADAMDAAQMRAPAVVVVGDVVSVRERIRWFESRPLFGKRIVVTRARHQAASLVRRLSALGADVVPLSCIEIDPAPSEALDGAVSRVHAEHDGLILSSPNGARALRDALARLGRDARWLAGITVAAIGHGTAATLREFGVGADIVADVPRSEGLLDELQARGLTATRWLHIAAEQVRPVLKRGLESTGGTYAHVVGYRTVKPVVPELLLRSLLPAKDGGEGVDAVYFASGRTAQYFDELVRDSLGDERARASLAAAAVVCVGPITTEAVEALGHRVTTTASGTADDDVVSAITAALRHRDKSAATTSA